MEWNVRLFVYSGAINETYIVLAFESHQGLNE